MFLKPLILRGFFISLVSGEYQQFWFVLNSLLGGINLSKREVKQRELGVLWAKMMGLQLEDLYFVKTDISLPEGSYKRQLVLDLFSIDAKN